VFDLRISPSVVYVVVPWMLVWPNVDWYLFEVKRNEKDTIDLVNAFNYHVMKENSSFTQIYTDGAKKPEPLDFSQHSGLEFRMIRGKYGTIRKYSKFPAHTGHCRGKLGCSRTGCSRLGCSRPGASRLGCRSNRQYGVLWG